MIRSLFVGLPTDTLNALQAQAVATILAGKTLMSYSIAGKSFAKVFPMSPADVLAEVNYALAVAANTVIDVTYPSFGVRL